MPDPGPDIPKTAYRRSRAPVYTFSSFPRLQFMEVVSEYHLSNTKQLVFLFRKPSFGKIQSRFGRYPTVKAGLYRGIFGQRAGFQIGPIATGNAESGAEHSPSANVAMVHQGNDLATMHLDPVNRRLPSRPDANDFQNRQVRSPLSPQPVKLFFHSSSSPHSSASISRSSLAASLMSSIRLRVSPCFNWSSSMESGSGDSGL